MSSVATDGCRSPSGYAGGARTERQDQMTTLMIEYSPWQTPVEGGRSQVL